jgi:acetyl-CoA carboxylase carboxyltransferase component
VLRKGFGGGYITMNAKDLGSDLVLAWPTAEIGVMGPKQAVTVMHRREIAESDDPGATRDRLAEEYAEEHLDSTVAARYGFVDEVIEPADTRARIDSALGALAPAGRYGNGPGNIPL